MEPIDLIGKTVEILDMNGGSANSFAFPFQVGSKLVVKECYLSGMSEWVLTFENGGQAWHAILNGSFKVCDPPSVPQAKLPRWGNLETTEDWRALIGEYVEIIDPRGAADIRGYTYQVVDAQHGALKLRGHWVYEGQFWCCYKESFRVVSTPSTTVQGSTVAPPTKEEVARRYPPGTKYHPLDSLGKVLNITSEWMHEPVTNSASNISECTWWVNAKLMDFVFANGKWAPVVEQVPIPPAPISNPAARQWTDYSFDEIWEEAKRRYPIGTMFASAINGDHYMVKNHEINAGIREHWNTEKKVWFHVVHPNPDFKANVYSFNKWARIVEPASTVISEPDYDAILNKAINDYPVGCSCKVLTANGDVPGNIREVIRKPNWVGDRRGLHIDGGVDYLYVKGKWAEKVGTPVPTPAPEESLLDKAIRRYPIGIKVKTVNSFGFSGEETVTGTPRMVASDVIDWSGSNAYLYRFGRWAEVITTTAPAASNRDDIMAEARRRYPAGTIAKCLTGNSFERITGNLVWVDDYCRIRCFEEPKTRLWENGQWAEVQEPSTPEVATPKDILAEALEECKRRYPPGTRVIPIQGSTNKPLPRDGFTVRGNTHRIYSKADESIDLGGYHGGLLYSRGTWAQIVGFEAAVSEESPNVELKISTPDNTMTGVKAEKIIETPLVEKKKHIYF